jgi:hypothetical protein
LHIEGFSTSAKVDVYNLVGQKIAAVKSLNGKSIAVSKENIYIVTLTENSKLFNYKVLAK